MIHDTNTADQLSIALSSHRPVCATSPLPHESPFWTSKEVRLVAETSHGDCPKRRRRRLELGESHLEVGRAFDLVASSEPLDGRRRLPDDATLESDQFTLGALDVLKQLRELGRNVARRRRRRVHQVAQRYNDTT